MVAVFIALGGDGGGSGHVYRVDRECVRGRRAIDEKHLGGRDWRRRRARHRIGARVFRDAEFLRDRRWRGIWKGRHADAEYFRRPCRSARIRPYGIFGFGFIRQRTEATTGGLFSNLSDDDIGYSIGGGVTYQVRPACRSQSRRAALQGPHVERSEFSQIPGRTRARRLSQHLDHDATILRPAVARVVRRYGLVFAVADHVDLVQRNLIRLVEIPLHVFRSRQPEPLVASVEPVASVCPSISM